MSLVACAGLWMCLVLGDEAELISLFLHNKIALQHVHEDVLMVAQPCCVFHDIKSAICFHLY